MATSSGSVNKNNNDNKTNKEGSAAANVTDQISQAVQSTSNLLHLMQQSSASQKQIGITIKEPTTDLAPKPKRTKTTVSKVKKAIVLSSSYGTDWSDAHLIKLPKNLLAKASTVQNTGQVLEQLPRVISSLEAYTESSLQSAPQLKTVSQLLSHMESSQLRSAFPTKQCEEERKESDSDKIVGTI